MMIQKTGRKYWVAAIHVGAFGDSAATNILCVPETGTCSGKFVLNIMKTKTRPKNAICSLKPGYGPGGSRKSPKTTA